MKNKKLITAAFAVAALVLAAAFLPISGDITAWEYYMPGSFTDVASERASLFDGIQSYQGVDEFKTTLAGTPYTWTEKDLPSSAVTDKRPPYNIHTITVINYPYDAFTGKLEVIFFNDRMMSTIYRPSDIGRFVEYLSLKQGLTFNDRDRADVPPYTLVRRGTDYKGREYIIWTDTRLQKQSKLWALKYS